VRHLSDLQTMDPSASIAEAALSHAEYLANLGPQQIGDAHQESAAKAGFTGYYPEDRLESQGVDIPAGHHVREVVAWNSDPSELEALAQWVDSVYHRPPILDPGLTSWGFALYQGFSVLVLISQDPSEPVVLPFPLPEQEGVPAYFNTDEEVPDPSAEHSWVGYPVSVTIRGATEVQVLESRLELDGQTLASNPLGPDLSLSDSTMLLALDGLPSGQTIDARFVLDIDGQETTLAWSFLTQD